MKTIRKSFWPLVFVLAIAAMYVTLYRPDMLVDPTFHDTSITKPVVPSTNKPIPVTVAPKAVQSQISNDNAAPAQTTASAPAVAATSAETPAAPSSPAETPPTTTTDDCAPDATSQDPCKLGQCFGYPYGICESNPNQGDINKDDPPTPTD